MVFIVPTISCRVKPKHNRKTQIGTPSRSVNPLCKVGFTLKLYTTSICTPIIFFQLYE